MEREVEDKVVSIIPDVPDDGNLYFMMSPTRRWLCLNTVAERLKKADAHMKRKLKNKETL